MRSNRSGTSTGKRRLQQQLDDQWEWTLGRQRDRIWRIEKEAIIFVELCLRVALLPEKQKKNRFLHNARKFAAEVDELIKIVGTSPGFSREGGLSRFLRSFLQSVSKGCNGGAFRQTDSEVATLQPGCHRHCRAEREPTRFDPIEEENH